MYLVINKCVTAVKVSDFSDHYLRNRSTLDIGVLGYIGIVQHKEHFLEVLSIPPGTPCINILTKVVSQTIKYFFGYLSGRNTENGHPTQPIVQTETNIFRIWV